MEFADHNKFDLRATRFQDVLDKAEKDGVGKVSIAGEWDSKTQIRILPWSEHAKLLLKPMSKKNNAGILNNDAPVCTTSNYATQMANLVFNVMFGFFRARFETKNTFTDVLV